MIVPLKNWVSMHTSSVAHGVRTQDKKLRLPTSCMESNTVSLGVTEICATMNNIKEAESTISAISSSDSTI